MRIVKTAWSMPVAAALMAALFPATPGWSHGIWVAERHGDLAIVYGHGSSDEAYDTAKVVSLRVLDESGNEIGVSRIDADDHVAFEKAEGAVVAVSLMDNGYWSKSGDGKWVNKAKDEVDGASEGGRYLKYSVTILDHLHGAPKPQGLDFEIVPLADPTEMKSGDSLEVQVLADGRSLAGIDVIAEYTTDSDTVSATTDAEGKATIVIRNQGLNVIAASHNEALADKTKADHIGHFATLTFNLHFHSE